MTRMEQEDAGWEKGMKNILQHFTGVIFLSSLLPSLSLLLLLLFSLYVSVLCSLSVSLENFGALFAPRHKVPGSE